MNQNPLQIASNLDPILPPQRHVIPSSPLGVDDFITQALPPDDVSSFKFSFLLRTVHNVDLLSPDAVNIFTSHLLINLYHDFSSLALI